MNTKRSSRDYIVRTAMTLLVMLFTSATAWAETEKVSYIDENGAEKQVDATILTSETDISSNLSGGWYIVKNTNSSGVDVSFSSQVNFNGNTSLILADGAHIEIKGDNGIVVQNGSLTIYGQSGGTGFLSTKAIDKNGGDGIYATGNISIVGGIITTTSDYHYGITSDGGDITISGGTITTIGSVGIYATGNITLGYKKDTDRILANSYGVTSGNISISSGKTMIDGETSYSDELTSSQITKISNKILAPNLFGIGPNNDGSSSKPYIINSCEGLQLLATYVNSGTICVQSSDSYNDVFYVYKDKHFTLNDDIAFNSSIENNFTPIGGKFSNNYYAFCGSFDGGNHTISGIYIDYIDYEDFDNSDSYAGIFGLLGKGAEIKNITLDNANISGKEFIGGIVGKNEDGSISNCLVTNSSIYGISSNHKGVIAGLNTSEGILNHNYYSGCKYDEVNGCGTDSGSHDVEENDGVVSATILSESETVPSDLSGKVVFRRVFTGGSASTICMPFAYTPNESDGTFYTFEGITKETKDNKTEYVATMQETNKAPSSLSDPLSANTPYLFMPAGTGIKTVLFHGSAAYNANTSYTPSGSNWTFTGTYDVVSWDDDNNKPEGIYGFSAQTVEAQDIYQGQFVKVGEYVKIRSLRAYLQYTTDSNSPNTRGTLSEEELPDRILVRLVDSDGDITGIGELDMKTGEVTFDNGWYTLEGVRLSGKPAKHGIYVNNGRKCMIK